MSYEPTPDTSERPLDRRSGPLRTICLITYGCFGLGLLGVVITIIVGVVICYLKRGEAAGTIYESHFTWLIRTFWIGLGLSVLGLILLIIAVGWLLLVAVVIWFIVRLLKGVFAVLDGRPIENPDSLI